MKFMFNKLHLNRLFCCNHTCYCVYMVLGRQSYVIYRQRQVIARVIKVDPRCTYVVLFQAILRNWTRQFRSLLLVMNFAHGIRTRGSFDLESKALANNCDKTCIPVYLES